MPTPGDVLAGIVRQAGDWHDGYGNTWPALLVDEGGRDRLLVVRHWLLRKFLDYHRPRVGDELVVRYDGKRGRTCEYTVRVGRTVPEPFDWDLLRGRAA
jgi:hypothetical protein